VANTSCLIAWAGERLDRDRRWSSAAWQPMQFVALDAKTGETLWKFPDRLWPPMRQQWSMKSTADQYMHLSPRVNSIQAALRYAVWACSLQGTARPAVARPRRSIAEAGGEVQGRRTKSKSPTTCEYSIGASYAVKVGTTVTFYECRRYSANGHGI